MEDFFTVLRKSMRRGHSLSDIAFLNGDSRVLASDTCGAISMLDRRLSDLPRSVLTTKKNTSLTSIQLLGDQHLTHIYLSVCMVLARVGL
ncbi:hypothetical protein HanXRQr2_Chr17g0778801 [Helianthus annuus]|uniref:Uncharacterized protein n=1 Tax=Helianthus annuus TaxID=4232 RepID=A0A9K3DEC1_HELAN|nr:hypothetical protein HanXRQr2_Chr17g0778801 [Helianthus annuus]